MQKLVVNVPFFLWFSRFMSKKGLNDVYMLPSVNVQTNLSKLWHLVNGTSMVSVHLLTHQPINLFVEEKTVLAFPYKSGQDRMDTDAVQLGDLKKFMSKPITQTASLILLLNN